MTTTRTNGATARQVQPQLPWWLLTTEETGTSVACIQARTADIALQRLPDIAEMLDAYVRQRARHEVVTAVPLPEGAWRRIASYADDFFAVYPLLEAYERA
jgi:hypothetical protein